MHSGSAIHIQHWVIAPEGFTGDWIDGGNLPEGGGGIEHAIHHQRSHLIGIAAERTTLANNLVGVANLFIHRGPSPCRLQALHIVSIDLIQRRIFTMAEVTAIGRPFAIRSPLLCKSTVPESENKKC